MEIPKTEAVFIMYEKYVIKAMTTQSFGNNLYNYVKEMLEDLINKHSESKETKFKAKNKYIFYLMKTNNDINVNYIVFYEGTQNDENRKFYSLFLREINDKFIDCLKKNLKDINNIREFLKMLREKKKHIDLFNEHLQEIWYKFDDIKIKKYKLIQFKCNKIHDNLKENLSLMLKRNENLKLINSLSESLENNSAEFYKNVKSTFTQKWKILIYKYFNYIIIIIIIFLILI